MTKRVFFSFHYDDVKNFRVNVVRNHNVTKDNHGGYFDASIWEESKKKGDIALKRMINKSLENTSVTCVLIGSKTYERTWVMYEIFRSLEKRNKLFGIHINKIKDKNQKKLDNGPNPFNFLGILFTPKQGSNNVWAIPYYLKDRTWAVFNKLDKFECQHQPLIKLEHVYSLSQFGYQVYDWEDDNGYTNFKYWIENA